jgi:hypothetical protein
MRGEIDVTAAAAETATKRRRESLTRCVFISVVPLRRWAIENDVPGGIHRFSDCIPLAAYLGPAASPDGSCRSMRAKAKCAARREFA